MAYTELSELIQDTVEALVKVGVSRKVAESTMHGVEWDAVMDLRQADEDQRLLDLFTRYETVDIAKRFNKSPRRMRELKAAAENRRKVRHTAAA